MVLRDIFHSSFYGELALVEFYGRFLIMRIGPNSQDVLIGHGHAGLGVPQEALELHGPVLDLGAGAVLQ